MNIQLKRPAKEIPAIVGEVALNPDTNEISVYDGTNWTKVGKASPSKRELLAQYLEELYDLSEEEFTSMLKKHYPEKLV